MHIGLWKSHDNCFDKHRISQENKSDETMLSRCCRLLLMLMMPLLVDRLIVTSKKQTILLSTIDSNLNWWLIHACAHTALSVNLICICFFYSLESWKWSSERNSMSTNARQQHGHIDSHLRFFVPFCDVFFLCLTKSAPKNEITFCPFSCKAERLFDTNLSIQ